MPREPIPPGYPAPQVEVHLARNISDPIPQSPGRPTANGLIPEADWTEVGGTSKGRSIGGIIWDSSKWLMREAVMPALYKLVPQGAQEIANGLFTGNPYWPGGETGHPVSIPDEPTVMVGLEPSNGLENFPAVASYEDLVATYATRQSDQPTQEITR